MTAVLKALLCGQTKKLAVLGSGLQSNQTTGTTKTVCTLLAWGMDTLGMMYHAITASTLLVLQVINLLFNVAYYHCYYTLYSLSAFWLAAYFENLRDFVDKHDYSIICYPIISAGYTVRGAHCAPLVKEREHLNGFKWSSLLVSLSLYFYNLNKIYLHFTQYFFVYFP